MSRPPTRFARVPRRGLRRAAPWPAVLAAGLLLSVPAAAQSGQEGSNGKMDYALARRDIQTLESALTALIGSTFAGPFTIERKPKGVYLQGYGFMIEFLVNIHRAVLNTPFGEFRDREREITPEQKKKRIDEFKEKLVRCLVERSDSLRQLRRDDSVTIVAFFEDRNFPGEAAQNKTIVLRAFKRDFDEQARKDWRELFRRMEIVEY
jgi:hypothetical protein